MLKGRRMSKSNHLIKDISFHNSHQSSNMNALASIISPSLKNNTNTIIPHSRTTTTSGTTTHRPVSRSVSEDSVSSSHSSQKSIDYQSKKKRKTSHHPKDSSKRITTSGINCSKNSSSNNQEVIILDENHDTNPHNGASPPPSTPTPMNKSLANILEKDHERSLRVAALLKKTHSLSSSSPSPFTNIKKQELLKHNAMMKYDNTNANFRGIQNTCTISPTIISNPQSSTISVSTNSSSSSSGNKSCHNKVALQTKDIPPSKQQQEQEHIVTKNKHRKRGRPTIRSNIMAYDSKKYTVKELKRVAKKSREICNAMEQREQKRLDELANRLFESSSSDEKEE
mmetsp:Transcript_9978/g.18733  ORF Transcript_9978/g.18733 Transcript_9978/m.18733 type:complete len:340 (+) Transcript_9978:15-1034(+)